MPLSKLSLPLEMWWMLMMLWLKYSCCGFAGRVFCDQGQIAQLYRRILACRNPNNSASAFCYFAHSVPKGNSPSSYASSCNIAENKNSHLFFTDTAWCSFPTGSILGFVYIETIQTLFDFSQLKICIFFLLCENNYQD